MTFAARNYIVPLHRWVGLTVGVWMVIVALTGAGLLFRPKLEPVFSRDLITVAACTGRAPLDALAANARAVHPADKPIMFSFTGAAAGAKRMAATQIRFSNQDIVYLDPCTGAVLSQKYRFGGLFGIMENLHRLQFDQSSIVSGTVAILFSIVLVLGGLFIWMPATLRGLKHAVRFDARLTGPARLLSLHKSVGLYASVVLLVAALTGLPNAFKWYKEAIWTLTGSALPALPKVVPPEKGKRLPMETIWQRALAIVPDPAEAVLRIPGKPTDAVEAYFTTRDAPHPNARAYLYLDAYTGETLRFTPYDQATAGSKLYLWSISWHTGQIGGLFVQLLLLLAMLCVPVLAYAGISRYLRRKRRASPATDRLSVRVEKKTYETRDICRFELVSQDGKPLPPFSAGSHIEVLVPNGLRRQYSLCNSPAESGRYVIAVLKVVDSRGGSSKLHAQLHEGDTVQIGTPKNHFPLVESAQRSLLIAGGIGITPILSMAEHLASIGAQFDLHYCVRSAERAAFTERITQSAFAARVTFHLGDNPESRLDIAAILAATDLETHIYACGPATLMEAVMSTAKQYNWPESQLHQEYFAGAMQASEADVPFEVMIASTGKIITIAKEETVVAALAAAGIDIPTSCEDGVCGTCVTRILDGEPDYRDRYLTPTERARNDQFTPCCSRARSSMLVLDL